MKKTLFILSIVLVCSLFAFGTAHAANYPFSANSLVMGANNGTSTTYKMSKNVSMYFSNYIGTTGEGTGYTIATYHSAGSRTHGSGSLDQKLYYYDALSQAPPDAPDPGSNESSGFEGAGWNPL